MLVITSYFTLSRLNSLLDSYLSKIQRSSGESAEFAKAAKSGQPDEDEDEVEDRSLGIKSKDKTATVKKHKKDPLPTPVKEAQIHAMQQSSSLSSGFASIADSFKPDTPEQFEAKALAASKLLGLVSYFIVLLLYYCLTLACRRTAKRYGAAVRQSQQRSCYCHNHCDWSRCRKCRQGCWQHHQGT
jgi:hypothetical protein